MCPGARARTKNPHIYSRILPNHRRKNSRITKQCLSKPCDMDSQALQCLRCNARAEKQTAYHVCQQTFYSAYKKFAQSRRVVVFPSFKNTRADGIALKIGHSRWLGCEPASMKPAASRSKNSTRQRLLGVVQRLPTESMAAALQ
jgi:hypothetical protein